MISPPHVGERYRPDPYGSGGWGFPRHHYRGGLPDAKVAPGRGAPRGRRIVDKGRNAIGICEAFRGQLTFSGEPLWASCSAYCVRPTPRLNEAGKGNRHIGPVVAFIMAFVGHDWR